MDTKNYFKNEASRKSLNIFRRGVNFVIILIMIFACKKEDGIELFLRELPPTITITQQENGIKISWDKVRGTDCYEVNRGSADWNEYNDILYLFNSYYVYGETFFIDENPMNGTNYYRIHAIKCKALGDCYSNGYSNVVSFNFTAPDEDTEMD